jgi:formylglycine-generating enzyme required for sulfatase activity
LGAQAPAGLGSPNPSRLHWIADGWAWPVAQFAYGLDRFPLLAVPALDRAAVRSAVLAVLIIWVELNAWMPRRGAAVPSGSGRKRGRGPQHLAYLLKVVGLLLDLADTNSAQGWKRIKENASENVLEDLQQALIVSWHQNRLLVTSSRKDPEPDERESKSVRHSEKSTLNAIEICLKLAKPAVSIRSPDLQGRKADADNDLGNTPIRDSLNNLADLNLREDTERRKPYAPRNNDKYWSFWIIFPPDCKESKRNCLAFIEKKWSEELQRLKGEEAQQLGSQLESLALAERNQRLDNLDHWVQVNLTGWRQRFEARDEVRDRRIYVPLATEIRLANMDVDAAGMRSVIRELRPEDIHSVVAQNGSQMLMIWEEGGAGKTSLALEIARWGLDRKLAEHVMLPILLDPTPGKGDLVEQVYAQLSHVDRSIGMNDVRDLLIHRRLLVIIDHFSECTRRQREWLLEKCQPQDLDLVLLTSRLDESRHFPGWMISKIQPQRLKGDQLLFFFDDYLARRTAKSAYAESPAHLLLPEDQVRTRDLLERMVGNKPITVLLAWMVIEKAIEHIQDGRVDLLPSSVPELMLDYVDRSSSAIPPEERSLAGESGFIVDAALLEEALKVLALAAHRQDDALKPQNFDLSLAQKTLSTSLHNDVLSRDINLQSAFLRYLDEKLNLLQRKGGSPAKPEYRISLDPLADYLAALALLEGLTNTLPPVDQLRNLEAWLDHLSGQLGRARADSDQRSQMRGFLSACRDVSKDWLTRLPDAIDPSLREQWNQIPHRFAQLAGIDPLEERQLEARHLIRRHAGDLAWANPELRPKALAELSAYAREFAGSTQLGELEEAVDPVKNTLQKTSLPVRDRAAAAEALGLIGSHKAADALERMIGNDHEPSVAVRRAAAEALGLIAAVGSNRQRHWDLLEMMLTAESLQGETDPARIAAVLPLLQGASRGLQRLASRRIPEWGSGDRFDVPMLTLTTTAGALTTRVLRIPVWQVPLPGGLCLELVEVPGGTDVIGSQEGEEGRENYGHRPEIQDTNLVEARRSVSLPGFLLARYPLTQAQWRSLADPGYVIRRALAPDPAQNKGVDLPVECVSWYDANEWCARLEHYLQQQPRGLSLDVRLPSETQWEFACRAGSSAPFHFGDTIDASWANYDGNYVYPGGQKGIFLGRTSAVGAYGLVNRMGLADLHGNVWEWCGDIWHPSALVGPRDGTAQAEQIDGLRESRLLRGGSWFSGPHYCRAAYRISDVPAGVLNSVGFRPGCFAPPGSLLGS